MSITYHSIVCQKCAELQQRIDELERQLRCLEQFVTEYDLICRALTSKKLSLADRLLYIALNQTYPCLIDGISTQVSVKKVREQAAWIGSNSATRFFRDMQSIGAFTYDDGTYDKKQKDRVGYLVPNPDIFPYPELMDTQSVQKREKERKAAKDKRDLVLEALKRFNCENCGSMQLGYIAKCESCGHIHTQDLPIPVEQIEVKPAKDGEDIDWDKEIEAYEGAA